MHLYNLGSIGWVESQLIYHVLPRLGREGLILLSPASPYLCIGYHQDAAQEVDLDYCREHGIPVFRREVGGGAVYLDGDQLFYQLVIHRDHPAVPRSKDAFYQRFLQPVIDTYRDMGVDARYKPVNDIITAESQKISGNGVAEIGPYVIFVGNVIVDFNYDMMVRTLRVPDEKFRDKIHKTMYDNLTTARRLLGDKTPSRDAINRMLAENFSKLLGPLEPAGLDDAILSEVEHLKPTFLSDDWLMKKGRRVEGREVRISAAVNVNQKMYKAPGGLIRATTEVRDGAITWVSISGDFFIYPEEAIADLEARLVGVREDEVEGAIAAFYTERSIESPGVEPADIARVIVS
jgi:lipoate-protein ligase A